jgi:ABC-type sugar transport system permease subunit
VKALGRVSPLELTLYLLPTLAVVALVFGYPLVRVVQLSFIRADRYVGFENYAALARDEVFRDSLLHNAQLLLAVPIMIVLAVPLAMLLHQRPAGWRFYRTVIFLPYIVAIPVTGIAIGAIVSFRGGLNQFLRAAGLDVLVRDWLGHPGSALWVILAAIVWRELGFGIILFLARLANVDNSLFEAAELDGANWWARLRDITVPELRGVISFFAVIEVITVLVWTFAWVYVLTRGGPAGSTMVVDLYIFQQAIQFRSYGIAAAAAVVLLLVTTGLIALRFMLPQRQD